MARFTDRQLDDAKRTDLEAFLRARGERLKPSGAEYRWVCRDGSDEHDSVTVRGNEWFDHKRQTGGDAIGFLQAFMGLDFWEVVAELLGQCGAAPIFTPQAQCSPLKAAAPFTLPPKHTDMHRLYAYLCKSRGISHGVVTHFVRAGVLYEDAQYHNAVFVATDEKNQPQSGMKKGTLSGSGFRQTITGSDTRYAFHHKGTDRRVYVFEGAVDLLSFITLYPERWQRHSYLALDGLSVKPPRHFMQTHQNVQKVILCLDHDQAGLEAAQRVTTQLVEDGYAEVSTLLSEYKDWNEDIKARLGLPALPAQEMENSHDPPEPDITMTF